MDISPTIALAFSLVSRPGAQALLIGAGASISAGMPAAWSVQRDLILRLAASMSQEDEALGDGADEEHPFIWFEQQYGEKPTYDRLLEALAPTPTQRLNLLKPYFVASEDDRTRGEKQPGPAHHAIASMVRGGYIRLIVTLNFDHLIEEALAAAGIEPVVVNTEAGIAGLQPLHEYECLVVHLHGDYTHPEMRNTPDELDTYPEVVQHFLSRVLTDYGLVIAGWSGQWDPALRNAIDAVPVQRFPTYWVSPRRPAGEGLALAQRKSAVTVEQAADDFFVELRDRLLAIRERGERHPLDAQTVVSTAKRELDDVSSRAISTHDNLLREMRRMQEDPGFRALMDGTHNHVGDIEIHREHSLAAVQPLASLLAVLAYWGTRETDNWWREAIPDFALPPRYGQWSRPDPKLQVGAFLYTAATVAAVAA